MNNRLNTQELAELISQYTSKDKKEVEAFLREFVALVVDGVCRDQVVKVKGVGTFKIIQVEKRESIHVNTGERFLIPAHYKFSFLPDKDLREQVNKPFSIFETTEIGDDVDYTSFQESDNREEGDEEESVEEVMPDKEIPLSSNDQEERTEDLPLSEEEPSAEKEPEESIKLVEEPVPADPEPDPNPEPVEPEPAEPEPAVEPAPVSEEPAPEPERPGKSLGWGRYVMVAVVVLACCVGAAYWFLRPVPGDPTNAVPSKGQDLVFEKMDTIAVPVNTVEESPEVEPVKEEKPNPVIDSVVIRHGDRLTEIAQEYYGHKVFWGYIYKYNESVIQDPNNVPIGTTLLIPSPDLYGINAKDPESRRRAAELQTEILTRK